MRAIFCSSCLYCKVIMTESDEYGSMWDTEALLKVKDKVPEGDLESDAGSDRLNSPSISRKFVDDDGEEKCIDFVLVHEDEHKRTSKVLRKMSEEEREAKRRKRDLKDKQKRWRSKFLKNLERKGVEIKKDEKVSVDKTVQYYLLHIPWALLIHYAEDLNLRAPLQLREYKSKQWSASLLNHCKARNIMEIDVPNRPALYFTCTFRQSKLHNFLGSDDPKNYFKETDRQRIAWEILEVTAYGKKKKAEVGIERLLAEEVFDAAFPLHDGPFRLPRNQEKDPSQMCKRQVLFEYWAKWSRWYKYQPMDHIRDYFGEKIGIYFAWLGFYTSWLLPVAILGLLVFIGGMCNMSTNIMVVEICNTTNNFNMCPSCDTCKNWELSSTCGQTKLSYLFDHPGTVAFAIVMSFWAVLFLEYWKRKNASLAHHWEVMDYHEDERPRPEYAALAPHLEKNPVTGVLEPHFPPSSRLRRTLTGFTILIIMLSVVIIFVISVILYKCLIGIILMHSSNYYVHVGAGSVKSLSGAVLNLILIMLMAQVYTEVARYLTRWEMHRTQTEYENAFTFKVFIFQFVNYYSSIFYIAFFKGNLVGIPGHYSKTLGVRNESCGSGGCLIELAEQLFVIMIGKQAINNIQEIAFPKIKQWWNTRRMKQAFGKEKEKSLRKPWDHEYGHLVNYEGLFEEYLEMVLQFGFITIFVAAFPIAPVFALLNNWLEIRLDASKLVCETRRPVADRAQNIGVWFSILDGIVQIAVITNAFLIAFTSDFIPKVFYMYWIGHGELKGYVNFTLAYAPYDAGLGDCRYKGFRDRYGNYTMHFWMILAIKLAFVICFEHVVFFVGRMIDWIVPDVPQSLELKIKREHYLAKQALADNQDTNLEVLKLYNRPTSVVLDENEEYDLDESAFIAEIT
ncbi:anoctamin-7-like [Styela clava]